MKLVLSLSVLAVALLMVLEGPAPAQAESGILDDLQKPWDTVKETVQKVIETVKNTDAWKWLPDRKWFPEAFDKVKETIKKKLS